MNTVRRLWLGFFAIALIGAGIFYAYTAPTQARNVHEYRDLISDSGPDRLSNHTFSFTIMTDVSPGGYFDIEWPSGFELTASSTFGTRNVELKVNGVTRASGATAAPGVDRVDINTGNGGSIRYTLAPDSGITAGSRLQFKVGNHTADAIVPITTYSTSTGTTTTPGDPAPIKNSNDTGTHEILLEVYDGGLVASAGFLIAVIDKITIPPLDTTETIPPFRFNGAPSGTVSAITPNVELSVETDEFAWCRIGTEPGIPYEEMENEFNNTGFIVHSGEVVPVVPEGEYTYYVRCIDDEGNINPDDYVINFVMSEIPDGTPNPDGGIVGDGDGTGSGGDGTGEGTGSGTGGGEGDHSGGGSGGSPGSGSGGGGSGGGGGGGSGGGSGSSGGGGFESEDAPYRSGDGQVVISGYAFPNSDVTILVDGEVADTVDARGDGSYSITLEEIARGVYTFGVYAVSGRDLKSSTFSTSFTVTGSRTTTLSNINIAPSIDVSPDPVDPGQTLTLSGRALPNAVITIENGRRDSSASMKKTVTTTSDSSGSWTTTISTNDFSKGTYEVRAKAVQSGGASTNYSEYTYYGVGESAEVPMSSDLNRDGRVNLTDFSILLYWWNSDGGNSDPSADINGDGKVNLTDFSILLFNWSG